MPDATVSHDTTHCDLKSLEGAFVKLRQLPYHDMLVRRDKGSIASMEQQINGKRGRSAPETAKMTLESLQTWEKEYMFKNCIVEHNLEDKAGNLLDFRNSSGITQLRPDIGLEIEQLIDELNGGEGAAFQENFPTAPTPSSEQQEPTQLTPLISDSSLS